VDIAHTKACEMLHSSFSSKEDHKCIDVAMDNFPMIAIFMAQIHDQDFKKKKNKKHRRSMFDMKDTSQLQCLAAVNYFREDTKTQVLWLATTLEAPPLDSIHVIWQKHGLATYLLCMLVKQHTGISTIEHSILSLQASHQRNNPVCSFYLKLGFSCHNEFEDNGLSQTSKGFQEAVQKFPELWVPAQTESMSFFRLCQGRLNLSPNMVDLTESNSDTEISWSAYVYAKFPWPCPSMKRIEGYLDTCPILSWLSGEPLPKTERQLNTTRSLSTMTGLVQGER
jgi:hypothetical protein